MVYKSLPLVSLLILYVYLFALIGMIIMRTTSEENLYLSNYNEAFFNLFVCMTTANYPDVMLPAYKNSRLYFIFFFLFLVGSTMILSNMIIANFYSVYQDQIENNYSNFVGDKILKNRKFKRYYKNLIKKE